MNLLADDLVDTGAFEREAGVQPAQSGCGVGIAVTQALGKLNHERRGPQRIVQRGFNRVRVLRAGCEEAVGKRVRFLAGGEAQHDGFGQTAQIFHQCDAQRDRERPQFTDGEGLHRLIGLNEAGEFFNVEGAVGVGDERPGNAEHTRITGKRTFAQFRQGAVIAGRQIVLDLANLLVDDIKIVEHPFGRGLDGAAGGCRMRDGAIGGA